MKNAEKSLPDTNVIISYLVHDGLFDKAKEYFDRVITGETRALILESVVAESIYVLTKIYKTPRAEAAQSLSGLLRYKGVISAGIAELLDSLSLFATTHFDIVDCILAVKARTNGKLFTFDRDLERLSR